MCTNGSTLTKNTIWFQKNKSTAHALHIIRRIMDVGYRAGQSLTLVLLDWEKAFDKVDQEKMHEAIERMNVPEKYSNIIRQIYKNPTFMIEIDGQRSGWKQQQTYCFSDFAGFNTSSCLFSRYFE